MAHLYLHLSRGAPDRPIWFTVVSPILSVSGARPKLSAGSKEQAHSMLIILTLGAVVVSSSIAITLDKPIRVPSFSKFGAVQ